jgi:hypothetical protein
LRNVTCLIRVIPDGDANAPLDSLASLDHGLIVLLLLLKLLGSDGELHPDIELGDGYVDAEVREPLEVLLDGGGDAADDEVTLRADTVDGDPLALEVLDEVVVGIGLGVHAFDVVVVEVELGGGVGLAGDAKGGLEEAVT